ncbi:YceI family protein [Zobellia uliginosa]|uniref:YceI family protein n=1 Tax=Zobellia uliginosa TaxID=143224 RepID=UPI0026E24F18|nr:YceI family protein [Zobellia uliginosa]MDO6516743.1 YceI family protein [Zobellia uliginosa]
MKALLTTFVLCTTNLFCLSAQTTEIVSADIGFTFVSKDVEGSISGFKSTSHIDLDHIAQSKLQGSVSVATLKTGNFLRDWSLKGSKYFNADEFPEITFESETIRETEKGITVTGKLTLKGVLKTIQIDFIKKDAQWVGSTTLFSSDFGIAIKKERADNKVLVQINLNLAP